MDMVSTKQIRNICLLGHGSAGKTSVAEAMLYISEGPTVSEPSEREIPYLIMIPRKPAAATRYRRLLRPSCGRIQR